MECKRKKCRKKNANQTPFTFFNYFNFSTTKLPAKLRKVFRPTSSLFRTYFQKMSLFFSEWAYMGLFFKIKK